LDYYSCIKFIRSGGLEFSGSVHSWHTATELPTVLLCKTAVPSSGLLHCWLTHPILAITSVVFTLSYAISDRI